MMDGPPLQVLREERGSNSKLPYTQNRMYIMPASGSVLDVCLGVSVVALTGLFIAICTGKIDIAPLLQILSVLKKKG